MIKEWPNKVNSLISKYFQVFLPLTRVKTISRIRVIVHWSFGTQSVEDGLVLHFRIVFCQNVSWKRCLKQKSPFLTFSSLGKFFSWFWGTRTTINYVLRGTFTAPLLAYPSFAHFGFFFCTLAFSFAHRLLICILGFYFLLVFFCWRFDKAICY